MIGKVEYVHRVKSDEPFGCNALNGLCQYASGVVGQHTCRLYLGGYSSICRVYGVETVTHQYGTAGFALSALFGLRAEALLEERDYACLKNITPEQVIEKIEAIVG